MNLGTVSILSGEVDKSKIPPLHQKRILAFVNHFILNTCTFLNDFATKCEYKFIEVERKLQKVEAALIIIEEKLASIPGLEGNTTNITTNTSTDAVVNSENDENNQHIENLTSSVTNLEINNDETSTTESDNKNIEETSIPPVENGIKANEDARYRKFFKMLQFGVPLPAVKLKMASEQFNPDILDTPNLILPDGVPYEQSSEY